jgi:GAF domain-containing protein
MNISDASAREKMVYELGSMFTAQLGLEELIPLVIAKCREVLNADGVSMLLLDEERDELYFPYVSEDDPEVARRLSQLRFPAGSGFAGAALRSGQSEKVDDPQSDPRFYSEVDRKTGVTTKSLLVAPLQSGGGRLGVIEAVNPSGGGLLPTLTSRCSRNWLSASGLQSKTLVGSARLSPPPHNSRPRSACCAATWRAAIVSQRSSERALQWSKSSG